TKYRLSPAVTFFNQVQYSDILIDRSINPANLGNARIDATDFANESRVNFNLLEGAITGVAGIYYRKQKSVDYLNFLGSNLFDDDKTGLGIFSETTWKFADRWSLTGGLRYQRDEQTRTGTSPFIPGTLSFDGKFEEVLPRVALAYDISPQITIGALASKGYNPGGILLSVIQQEYVPFKKETLWNYELFARTTLLNGRLNVNANLFYTDFTDAQRQQSTAIPGTSLTDLVVLNAEDARSYGLEVSGRFTVTDSFRITGGFGLLQTEFKEFSAAVADLEGKEFQQAPGFMFNVGFDWEFMKGLTFGASVRHTDEYFSDDINTRSLGVDAFTVADFKLSYQPDERIRIFGYVNNAFDSIHATNRRAQPNRSGGQDVFVTIERPREFGVGASIKLN
ncbi:MAG: TonB-dependent receptor, partial [Pseudomonadota bacterium]